MCKPRTMEAVASGRVFHAVVAPNRPRLTHLCRGAPRTLPWSGERIDRIRDLALAGGLANLLRGVGAVRVLLVHPSPLLFSEIYLRLEPLGLERVATAIEGAGLPEAPGAAKPSRAELYVHHPTAVAAHG